MPGSFTCRSRIAGFTLVEMLVSVSIIALISGVIIFQYSKFDSQLLLRNLAYEVALEVREAQVLGVSVRGASGNFQDAYGVHFNTENNKSYTLFRDTDGGLDFDPSEAVSAFTIARGNFISMLCADSGSGCNSSAQLDIMFIRPEPDALVCARDSLADSCVRNFAHVKVEVSSSKDATSKRTVVVTNTGQISVE